MLKLSEHARSKCTFLSMADVFVTAVASVLQFMISSTIPRVLDKRLSSPGEGINRP